MLSLISNDVYIYIIVFLLLSLSIAYMFLLADEQSSIAQQNKKLLALSWITTSFGALLFFITFALLSFPLIDFKIKICMFVMGIILGIVGGFGLFIAYNDKFTDESKADKYNMISSVLSAVSFFALGNIVPKFLN